MPKLNTRFYMSMGLTSLVTTVLLAALYFDIVPDRQRTLRDGRAALGEAIAASGTAMLGRGDIRNLETTLEFVVERNPDLQSAALRRGLDTIVAQTGDHSPWQPLPDGRSTDDQIVVPLWNGGARWGQVEMRFTASQAPTIMGFPLNERIRLTMIIASASFVLFYLYLGRMLRYLDPSQAIPDRVRDAFDTLTEGLLVLDPKGYVVLANSAIATLTGQSTASLLGGSIHKLPWRDQAGEVAPAGSQSWATALTTGEPVRNCMTWMATEDGTRHTFLMNSTPIMTGSKCAGYLVSLDDVTELEQTEIELRKAKYEAESANRAKSEFLANMSHEIRTPMNAILGYAELLRRKQHAGVEETRKHLNTIHSSGTHLLSLINDILDLSKVESGRLEVERIDCQAHLLVQEIARALSIRASEKGVALNVSLAGPVPAHIQTDPARLRQIVTNIVGNAIKFTDNGSVEIRLSMDAGQPECYRIDIQDSGIGIPQDRLESIFEAFVQAESSTTRRFGGTGLGLSISRKLARALGGDVVASSVPGQGSTFHITLSTGPLADVPIVTSLEQVRTEESSRAPALDSWRFPAVRILVADDGNENRELIRLAFSETPLVIDQAENGQQAIDLAAKNDYALVLMDMSMPIMDGYTATARLRERGYAKPIVALTAHAMKGFEEQIKAAGCSHYMTKPIDLDRLAGLLAELVGAEHSPLAAVATSEVATLHTPAAEAQPDAAQVSIPSNVVPLVSRLHTHRRLHNAIRMFGERLQDQLSLMDQALADQDGAAMASLAHWLKGAGGSVGFDDFTKPAAALENFAKRADIEGMTTELQVLHGLAARLELPATDAIGATAKAPPCPVSA
ncbi:MAG: response regulator [Gammaproteobacteria bacterium]|nr:response regulator [Gammaproteobacteria bacterium]